MPRTIFLFAAAALLGSALGSARGLAQDVQPMAPPAVEPVDRPEVNGDDAGEGGDPVAVPIPESPNRAAAAARARARVESVVPREWASVVVGYQPAWLDVGASNGFGPARWNEWFAVAGLAPSISPHPFFGPWGTLGYEGWVFERYRAAWTGRSAERAGGETALWLQRADRAMVEGRTADAVLSYRRVVQRDPGFAPGHLGLGAALATAGDDEAAARAFRQSLDRYPGWLDLAVDWSRLFADDERLESTLASVAARAEAGPPSSRFVAGVLHLFGGRPDAGRAWLAGLEGDPHASDLIVRMRR